MPSLSCRARGHDEGFRRRASLWNRSQQQDCVRRRRFCVGEVGARRAGCLRVDRARGRSCLRRCWYDAARRRGLGSELLRDHPKSPENASLWAVAERSPRTDRRRCVQQAASSPRTASTASQCSCSSLRHPYRTEPVRGSPRPGAQPRPPPHAMDMPGRSSGVAGPSTSM